MSEAPKFLPHGKYKNVPIDEVPTDYLAWIIDNCESGTAFYELAEEEFVRRKNRG